MELKKPHKFFYAELPQKRKYDLKLVRRPGEKINQSSMDLAFCQLLSRYIKIKEVSRFLDYQFSKSTCTKKEFSDHLKQVLDLEFYKIGGNINKIEACYNWINLIGSQSTSSAQDYENPESFFSNSEDFEKICNILKSRLFIDKQNNWLAKKIELVALIQALKTRGYLVPHFNAPIGRSFQKFFNIIKMAPRTFNKDPLNDQLDSFLNIIPNK